MTALLLPYLLFQSITAGVMPVATDHGFTFVICTGDRVVEAVLRPDGSYDFGGEHAEDDGCPWAIAHGPATPVDPPDFAEHRAAARALHNVLPATAAAPLAAARTPPARAPPHTV